MMARLGTAVAIGVLLTLGLVACGGASEEIEEVRGAVEEILGSTEPERCRRFSEEVLEQITGRQGEKAIETCEEQLEGVEPPERVIAAAIEVDGDTARSNFNTGQTAGRLELEKREGEWIITSLKFGINQPSEGGSEGVGGSGSGAGGGAGSGEDETP